MGETNFVRMGRPGPKGHGTESEYRKGCRCEECKAGMYAIRVERRQRIKLGATDHVVSADLARQHIFRLSRSGVGYKSVAEYTATEPRYIWEIRAGKRKRIRQSTEQRIMRIQLGLAADHGCVDARNSQRMLSEIHDAGYRKYQIAAMLGCYVPPNCPNKGGLQLGINGKILAKTERRIKRLHKQLVVHKVDRLVELASKTRVAA